ncbi:MAG: hypothetical protein IPN42_12850 [Methylococcaceae bacterium]|nr:hypothetical protein [Methylococcaceae bacterium]
MDHSGTKILRPRQILLFSGHMIDAPGRTLPRFPLNKATIAEAEIMRVLDKLDANHEDLALTQGASGGDLIFAECCQAKNVNIQFLQPFTEQTFIEQSVIPSEGDWHNRYLVVKKKAAIQVRAMPEAFLIDNGNPFEACNEWLLETALDYGAEKVRFICLWNGEGGDGAGGTAHMVEQVQKSGGSVIWLNTKQLW